MATAVSTQTKLTSASAQNFYSAIQTAKQAMPRGVYLTDYTVEEYSNKKCYLTLDDLAGFALADGDIVSVFKHPSYQGRATDVLIPQAVEKGGNRLDCFNGALPFIYAKFGFEPVAKVKFNREFAPKAWDYKRDQEPDVIFMVYRKTLAQKKWENEPGQTADDSRNDWVVKTIAQLPVSSDYDKGQQIQLRCL